MAFVIILSVVMLSVIMPNVAYKPFMLSAIMLGVVAPLTEQYILT